MKPIYAVFAFLWIGLCLGDDTRIQHVDHGPKAPIPQVIKTEKNSSIVHEVVSPSSASENADQHHDKTKANITTPVVNNESEIHPPHPTSTSTHAPPPPTSSTPVSLTPVSSTPAPTPTPAPIVYGVGSWNVTDHEGHACILLKGDIELTLFNETNNKIIQNYRIPKNAPSYGNCSKECIELMLPNNSSVHLMFAKNGSAFYLHAIKAKLSYEVENRTKNFEFSNETLHLFETPVDQSFYCEPASENLVVQKPLEHLMLKVSDFQVQAFKNSTTKNFDTALNCEAPHTPDVVPIVVGCVLALLVILVLVAYLISRRRSQFRGYVSM